MGSQGVLRAWQLLPAREGSPMEEEEEKWEYEGMESVRSCKSQDRQDP